MDYRVVGILVQAICFLPSASPVLRQVLEPSCAAALRCFLSCTFHLRGVLFQALVTDLFTKSVGADADVMAGKGY